MRLIKAALSKLKFSAGFSPEIETDSDFRKYIPEPYKSVLLISADFELAWAWRYSKNKGNAKSAIEKAVSERKNLPKILSVCDDYNIPVTWATVGHLFLESCEKTNHIPHADIPRLSHFENNYWKYEGKDWFEYDPCSNYKDSPEWYCPDLIRRIINSPVKHEIACHTFSHIDCRDEICPPEVMQAELKECKRIAKKWDLELNSFVHPGHTIGNLDTLANEGFTNFRTDYRNVLGYPKKHKNGIWEFEQTAEFNLRNEWSIDYHIYRYKAIIDRGLKTNTVCVFWFHPSFDSACVERIFPAIFKHINTKRDKIWVTTHKNYTDWLNTNKTEQQK